MAIGLHRLRLSPDTFWRMTPREFAAALGARTPQTPSLERFRALMASFPDG